jgi:hypothetical protein
MQCLPRIAAAQRLPARRGALIKAMDIDLDHAVVQQVAPSAGTQHRGRRPWCPIRFQHLPQIGHVRLERGYRRWWRPPGPQLLDDHVDRHRLTHSADQQREQRTLLRRSQIDRSARDHRLYRPQRPEFRHGMVPIISSAAISGSRKRMLGSKVNVEFSREIHLQYLIGAPELPYLPFQFGDTPRISSAGFYTLRHLLSLRA